jgi:hypothetical protein
MPNTYSLIASSTVGAGGAVSFDFTSIPSTYTDLVVKISGRSNSASDYFTLSLNGFSSNFTERYLYGTGSSVASGNDTLGAYGRMDSNSYTANSFGSTEYYIPNYAGANNKSISVDTVTEQNATASYQDLIAGLWSNSTAINQITLTPSTGNFVQYSTAYLYGIKNS